MMKNAPAYFTEASATKQKKNFITLTSSLQIGKSKKDSFCQKKKKETERQIDSNHLDASLLLSEQCLKLQPVLLRF